MLVKKKDPNWYPAENKGLKVGEVVEITDPKDLILTGKVVAVKKDGTEISAYDLYGVITVDERKDFEEYLKLKKQQALNQELKETSTELKSQLKETPKEVVEEEVPAPVIEAPKSRFVKPPMPKEETLSKL